MKTIVEKSLMHGVDWEPGLDLTGWNLSEKMDGVRCYWDGANGWTRQGRRITLASWITATLPTGIRLDGEIWAGRGRFTEASNAVLHGLWTHRCRFTAFDAPDHHGTWAQRMAEASICYPDTVPFVSCDGVRHVNSMLFEIQEAGGEGIVARSPMVKGYTRGRTNTFIKIKGAIYR